MFLLNNNKKQLAHSGKYEDQQSQIPFSGVRLGFVRDDDFSAGILIAQVILNIGHSRSSLPDLS